MDKKKCLGCQQDFYNGKNPFNIKECWNLKDAKIVWRKKVSIDQKPPWTQKAQRYPSCYQVRRYIFIAPNQIR